MNCPNCNAPVAENEQFCTECGTRIPAAEVSAPAAPVAPVTVNVPQQKPMTKEDLPDQFRVLSPWAYFGLQILYSIPIVGFVFLLIHTFSAGNLNRRSFARSYWCALLILGGLALIAVIIGVVLGLLLVPTEVTHMPATIR